MQSHLGCSGPVRKFHQDQQSYAVDQKDVSTPPSPAQMVKAAHLTKHKCKSSCVLLRVLLRSSVRGAQDNWYTRAGIANEEVVFEQRTLSDTRWQSTSWTWVCIHLSLWWEDHFLSWAYLASFWTHSSWARQNHPERSTAVRDFLWWLVRIIEMWVGGLSSAQQSSFQAWRNGEVCHFPLLLCPRGFHTFPGKSNMQSSRAMEKQVYPTESDVFTGAQQIRTRRAQHG